MPAAKPHNVVDIKTSRTTPFNPVVSRIQLASVRSARGYTRLAAKGFLLLVVAAYGLFGFAAAPDRLSSYAAQPTAEERAQLEEELAQLEKQIVDYEATVAAYKKQGTTLKNEISSLNAKIEKLNLQIKVVNLSLSRLNNEIAENQAQVKTTQEKIDFNRSAISTALQVLYEHEQTSLVTALLQNPNLSDFFGEVNDLLAVQESLTETIQKINQLKNDLLDEQEQLVSKKSDALAMKELQDQQKKQVAATVVSKDQLLKETKGSEQLYQQKLKETRENAAKIRNRIFALIGGGEMTFEQAYEFAVFAEKATAVPAAFLLAVLDRESNLGKNVGRCSYTKAMAPGPPKSKRDDITPFLQITSELGLDPEKTLVSCAIASDGAHGGAMGAAQFIPTTWMLYRDRIAAVTGSNPPSPWRNSDAFVGTALYLKDALAACANTSYNSGTAKIKCAAARYYAGGNWSRFLSSYGSATLSRMQRFEDDIAVLNSPTNS